jgi:squalene-hopene/tetraprenyl-beta-curcumene cyclase
MNRTSKLTFLLLFSGISGLVAGCSHTQTTKTKEWNPKSAASYLDLREDWWMQWPQTIRDHGTFCVSCHTAMPYALARPALRNVLGEELPTNDEVKLLENVRSRVRLGNKADAYYTDYSDGTSKSVEARGTEAVLNALILASHDERTGQLSPDTRRAFENLWALQEKAGDNKGSWAWLRFNLEPWEANDSAYYGATLAAVAVGLAPENYRSTPEIQPNLMLLQDYLDREYPKQSLINRVGLLWDSVKWPSLLDSKRRQALIDETLRQQREDGGWSLSEISGTWGGWSFSSMQKRLARILANSIHVKSDGYATGLITYCLLQSGVPRKDSQVERGLMWLERNQSEVDGRWPPYALSKTVDPATIVGRFRSDAATSFAVLALIEGRKTQPDLASYQQTAPSDAR